MIEKQIFEIAVQAECEEVMIDRKELIDNHNPILTEADKESALTVGNGELAFTADITGMQTLYREYDVLPLCTMSQWAWHTKPVSAGRYSYTLDDLVMTEYDDCTGRHVVYPKKKMPGNEEVYDWLRENPHRLNLARIGLLYRGKEISAEQLTECRQELKLYEGILESEFKLDGILCRVKTACHNRGKDMLGFEIESDALKTGDMTVELRFPYGAPDITASDWDSEELHKTEVIRCTSDLTLLKRQLDRDVYYIGIRANGSITVQPEYHRGEVKTENTVLSLAVAFGKEESMARTETVSEILEASRLGWKDFWEKGGIIRLNRSKDKRAWELERRIILSQYLMAVNSSGSMPPQETGLTCNSWYGKMHLEMYLWHCAWLPLWNHCDLLERSLKWYREHLPQARENAARNGYRGARWPKMIAAEGIDCPSTIAPLLVWQQPHIIYMLEMVYHRMKERTVLEENWQVVKETADFMVDFVVWNEEKKCYEICAPVIPVQECHRETDVLNPAFEVAYWRETLRIAVKWAERLGRTPDAKWHEVAEHMAELTAENGVYLAHEKCHTTFTEFNKDHPSMLGAYGLIDSDRINKETMRNTLHLVEKCWDYPTLWGWDFALMAMTAVRLNEPETAVSLLLKDTLKNCYLASGNNMQISRKDLPLYLPGNGSLLLAAAVMTAGYEGCDRVSPGFPDNGEWTVEFENIDKLPRTGSAI